LFVRQLAIPHAEPPLSDLGHEVVHAGVSVPPEQTHRPAVDARKYAQWHARRGEGNGSPYAKAKSRAQQLTEGRTSSWPEPYGSTPRLAMSRSLGYTISAVVPARNLTGMTRLPASMRVAGMNLRDAGVVPAGRRAPLG
jgi:hypothetical protein